MSRPQWDGQPVRVPTLAEVVAKLEQISEMRCTCVDDCGGCSVPMKRIAEDAIDALKTIDGALADVAHDFTKIRGQR